jgi:hypothetical protein
VSRVRRGKVSIALVMSGYFKIMQVSICKVRIGRFMSGNVRLIQVISW